MRIPAEALNKPYVAFTVRDGQHSSHVSQDLGGKTKMAVGERQAQNVDTVQQANNDSPGIGVRRDLLNNLPKPQEGPKVYSGKARSFVAVKPTTGAVVDLKP